MGVDTEGRPLKSLVDLAAAKGKSTGIAVTCRLWDATPADFCCHNKDRDAEAEIVADYVNCSADYVFGGGAKLFETVKMDVTCLRNYAIRISDSSQLG